MASVAGFIIFLSCSLFESNFRKFVNFNCWDVPLSYTVVGILSHSLLLKFLLTYGAKYADHIPSNNLKAVVHKIYLVHSWILCLILQSSSFITDSISEVKKCLCGEAGYRDIFFPSLPQGQLWANVKWTVSLNRCQLLYYY